MCINSGKNWKFLIANHPTTLQKLYRCMEKQRRRNLAALLPNIIRYRVLLLVYFRCLSSSDCGMSFQRLRLSRGMQVWELIIFHVFWATLVSWWVSVIRFNGFLDTNQCSTVGSFFIIFHVNLLKECQRVL